VRASESAAESAAENGAAGRAFDATDATDVAPAAVVVPSPRGLRNDLSGILRRGAFPDEEGTKLRSDFAVPPRCSPRRNNRRPCYCYERPLEVVAHCCSHRDAAPAAAAAAERLSENGTDGTRTAGRVIGIAIATVTEIAASPDGGGGADDNAATVDAAVNYLPDVVYYLPHQHG